ncbi:MAG: hypothetical protein J3Q66DRAFT_21727 [Benniella sp.]|nr:MAG: hypothetical protein J3Q66DRAFT_21727 [Benniella sp.]
MSRPPPLEHPHDNRRGVTQRQQGRPGEITDHGRPPYQHSPYSNQRRPNQDQRQQQQQHGLYGHPAAAAPSQPPPIRLFPGQPPPFPGPPPFFQQGHHRLPLNSSPWPQRPQQDHYSTQQPSSQDSGNQFQVHPLHRFKVKCAPFQQPTEIGSFSYNEQRSFLMDDSQLVDGVITAFCSFFYKIYKLVRAV